MGDIDIRAARDRIDTVEKRIAAMHDAGVDVAALRAQLAFAHHALREGRLADIEAICDEVLGAARRLAELGSRASQVRTPAHGTPALPQSPQHPPAETGTEAMRRIKIGRAQLADEVRAAIDAEVKTQMQAGPEAAPPLAGRLEALERRLATPPAAADLSPLVARLDALEGSVAAARQPDLQPLADRLAALEGSIAALQAPDLAPVAERLAQVEALLATAASPGAAAADLSPVAERLAALEDRLAALQQPVPAPAVDLAPIAARLDAMESRLHEHAGAAAGQAELIAQLRAVDARLAEIGDQGRTDPAIAAGLQNLDVRLAAIEARPATPPADEAATAAIVQRIVSETVPKQATELLREAISKLPTRDDLHQIAETLRADLDWRLEKAAAEHGWCSLSDVQTTVRKSIAEQDPGSGNSHLGRLEIAMAEFVQQSKEQQERLISALAERVVQHTKTLTKRMIVRDPPPTAPDLGKSRHETEELSPSLSAAGEGSSRMAAITTMSRDEAPAKRPTEMALDPVPPEVLDASRRIHGDTTLFTKRVEAGEIPQPAAAEAQPPPTEALPDLHDLVTAEVERALSGGAASTMTTVPTGDGEGSGGRPLPMDLSGPRPATASAGAPLGTPAPAAAAPPPPADLAVLVAAEVGRQMAMTVPVQLPPSDGDLARAIARALPQALQDEAVRSELFATLALEAAGKPGVLGELTGLRRFLKREIQQAVERQGQAVPTP